MKEFMQGCISLCIILHLNDNIIPPITLCDMAESLSGLEADSRIWTYYPNSKIEFFKLSGESISILCSGTIPSFNLTEAVESCCWLLENDGCGKTFLFIFTDNPELAKKQTQHLSIPNHFSINEIHLGAYGDDSKSLKDVAKKLEKIGYVQGWISNKTKDIVNYFQKTIKSIINQQKIK